MTERQRRMQAKIRAMQTLVRKAISETSSEWRGEYFAPAWHEEELLTELLAIEERLHRVELQSAILTLEEI